MSTPPQVFTINPDRLKRRTRNVVAGAALSALLAGLVGWGHVHHPQTYNDVLLWSIIGFVILANGVGYIRHRRYLRLAREHRVEIRSDGIAFQTGDTASEVAPGDIAAITVYRNSQGIGHIQILRTDERGIRLEDYADMEAMATALRPLIPAAHWTDR